MVGWYSSNNTYSSNILDGSPEEVEAWKRAAVISGAALCDAGRALLALQGRFNRGGGGGGEKLENFWGENPK